MLFEGGERDRQGPGDVTGLELLAGSHIHHDHVATTGALQQHIAPDSLHAIRTPEVDQAVTPVAALPKQDPDKTMVLTSPPVAPKPVDPDATQTISPIAEPTRDDPDKTRVIPPPK